MEARVSSEDLLEKYKALSAELSGLEAQVERVKADREVVCGKLLVKDGKGHPYDLGLGAGMEMVVATTKINTHYMAPKNKWVKSGRAPKPPKQPRTKKEKLQKPPRVVVKRAIVNGKIVEVPLQPKPASEPPAPIAAAPQVIVKKPSDPAGPPTEMTLRQLQRTPSEIGAATVEPEPVVPPVIEKPELSPEFVEALHDLGPTEAILTEELPASAQSPASEAVQESVEEEAEMDPLEAALAALSVDDLE